MRGSTWSAEEKETAIAMAKGGARIKEIARKLKRSNHSICGFLARYGLSPGRLMPKIRRPWSPEETAQAKKLLASGLEPTEVGQIIGRMATEIYAHIWIRRPRSGIVVEHVDIPPEVIEDRNRRYEEETTLEMLLFGDPHPSRSALRRR